MLEAEFVIEFPFWNGAAATKGFKR